MPHDAAAEDVDPSDRIVVVGRSATGSAAASASPVAVYVSVTLGSVTHSSAMTRMVILHDGPTILSPWHPVDTPRMVVNVGVCRPP